MDGIITMVSEKEIRDFASKCFQHNIDRYGFSFSEEGIFRSAFNLDGSLKMGWGSIMKNHHPSIAEYPELYEDPLFSAGKKKGKEK